MLDCKIIYSHNVTFPKHEFRQKFVRTILLCLAVAQRSVAENPFHWCIWSRNSKAKYSLHSWYQFIVCDLIVNPEVSHHPISIWLKAPLLKHQSQCHGGVLWCACSYTDLQACSEVVCYSAIIFVGTKNSKTCSRNLQVLVQVQVHSFQV